MMPTCSVVPCFLYKRSACCNRLPSLVVGSVRAETCILSCIMAVLQLLPADTRTLGLQKSGHFSMNGYYEMRVPGRQFWFGFWSKLAGQVSVWTLLRYFIPETGPSQLPTHPQNTSDREVGGNFDVTLMMHSQVWQHPDGGPGLDACSSWGPCSLHSIWIGKKRLLVTDMKMLYKVCLLGCYHGRR